MPKDLSKIGVYRIIHYLNLEYILDNGIYYRNSDHFDPNYINIGSSEIIEHRDTVRVKCYPQTTVNDYVPFYFGIRTPMLYKIKTGHGVQRRPQSEIIYLACSFLDLTNSSLQWCFTDGNAAKYITEFYNTVDKIHDLDWRSIDATEWTDNNSDGDHDRMRKKHAEFLVRGHVPVHFIKWVIVLTREMKAFVEKLIQIRGLNIKVHLDTEYKFYYQ
jgi:ssDNA thymidine ADP-ribosyltransferase, DarT